MFGCFVVCFGKNFVLSAYLSTIWPFCVYECHRQFLLPSDLLIHAARTPNRRRSSHTSTMRIMHFECNESNQINGCLSSSYASSTAATVCAAAAFLAVLFYTMILPFWIMYYFLRALSCKNNLADFHHQAHWCNDERNASHRPKKRQNYSKHLKSIDR